MCGWRGTRLDSTQEKADVGAPPFALNLVIRSALKYTSYISNFDGDYRVLCRFEGDSDGVAGGVRARASDVPLEPCVFCNRSMIASS
jgi:hypothetical protein